MYQLQLSTTTFTATDICKSFQDAPVPRLADEHYALVRGILRRAIIGG